MADGADQPRGGGRFDDRSYAAGFADAANDAVPELIAAVRAFLADGTADALRRVREAMNDIDAAEALAP